MDSNSPPSISCPECQNRLNPELVALVLNGKTVYCEVCGFPFHAIEDGEVKPLEKKGNYNFTQKNLTKEEVQWLKWKKEWKSIKNQIKTEFSAAFSGVFSKKPTKDRNYRESRQTVEKSSFESEFTPSPSPIHTPTNQIKPQDQKILTNLNTAKDVLVQLSPFYYVIIILVSFFTSLRAPLLFSLIGTLLIQFFTVIYDHKVFLSQDKENKVSHAGIPMIIFGLFSLSANGIGVFLLARGILNLLIFLKEAHTISSTHPAISDNPLIKAIWIREVLYSFIPYVFEMYIVYLLAGVMKDLGKVIVDVQGLGGFLYSLLMGGVVVIVVYRLVLPTLRTNPIEEIPTDKVIILIVGGIFAINYGAGSYLIIVGVLILVLQNMIQTSAKNLPDVLEIRDISNSLVVDGISPYESEFTPLEPQRPIIETPIIETPIVRTPKTKARMKRTPIRRFDPQTGKPITHESPSEVPTKSFYFEPIDNGVEISQLNIRVVPDPGKISDIIFTVLHPSIRKRLINLPIAEEEKDQITKGLIYLTMVEQKRFLSELEQVNISHEDYYSKYIKSIQGLSIAEDQQDFLIQQLNYLPDEEIEEFIRILETNIRK
ncbi:MAG: hypothetical protein ACTSYU_03140 [Promethearchaeota archaeon]